MSTTLKSTPFSSTSFGRQDIELATRAADYFTCLYYAAYDSDTRVVDLLRFYRESSSLLWNGKPIQGLDDLRQFIQNMPCTKHELQSFDCQPIPGTSPPSLIVVVSGNVAHGRGLSGGNPPTTPVRTHEGQLRVFSQTFILVPDASAPIRPGEVAKYYISADSLRFVGCIMQNGIDSIFSGLLKQCKDKARILLPSDRHTILVVHVSSQYLPASLRNSECG